MAMIFLATLNGEMEIFLGTLPLVHGYRGYTQLYLLETGFQTLQFLEDMS